MVYNQNKADVRVLSAQSMDFYPKVTVCVRSREWYLMYNRHLLGQHLRELVERVPVPLCIGEAPPLSGLDGFMFPWASSPAARTLMETIPFKVCQLTSDERFGLRYRPHAKLRSGAGQW